MKEPKLYYLHHYYNYYFEIIISRVDGSQVIDKSESVSRLRLLYNYESFCTYSRNGMGNCEAEYIQESTLSTVLLETTKQINYR